MKYNVYALITGSKFLGEYEADSPEEACAMAEPNADVSICHQCAKEIDDAQIDSLQAEPLP